MELWKNIKRKMLEHPQQTVCEGEKTLDFAELAEFAESFGKKLEGIKCCAILCRSELAAAKALLACFAAGVTAVPLSEKYGEKHCKKILDTVSPPAVIKDIGGVLKVERRQNAKYKAPEKHPELIMCTSGTTGVPKGAMLSEENILSDLYGICEYFNIGTSDSILISRPLYHCAVLTGELLVSLVKGVRVVFYSGMFLPWHVLRMIKNMNVTVFCGTPTLLSLMARVENDPPECLKTICISGECMGAETGRLISNAFPKAQIYHVYGLTEASPRVSYMPPDRFSEYPDRVGVPISGVELRLADSSGNSVSKGEGVLWIKGKNVMLGYYNAPELTSEIMDGEWLCTGDIAEIDENGYLRIKCRNDDLIIRGGMNIYPQEIESALKADPRVKEVLVYGINDGMQTEIGMKIVGAFADEWEVANLCMWYLPAFQTPTVIELVNELPKNGSGKIKRR